MKTRLIVATIMAGSVAAAAAQDPPSRPEQKAGQTQTQTITVTGCLQTARTTEGAEAQQAAGSPPQYILAQAKVTSDPGTPTGTSGSASLATADRFRLIADKPAEIKEHLNHRVEITGTLQPRSERGQAKGESASQKASTDADLPTLRVTSFKHLEATCGPDAR